MPHQTLPTGCLSCSCPPSCRYLLELRSEADFYGLEGLVNAIDRYPYGLTKVQRAVSLNTEDSWLYEDGQDEVRMIGQVSAAIKIKSVQTLYPGEQCVCVCVCVCVRACRCIAPLFSTEF